MHLRAEPADTSDVLILGASYLGAELSYLLRRRAPWLRVTVVDRQRSHGYIPLVHERLVGRIDWEDTRFRTNDFVTRQGARFVHGEIVSAEPRAKRVVLADGRVLSARFLVVALGSVTTAPLTLPGREHFVGHKLADETDAARATLARVLSRMGDEDQRPRAVVVGGGISGSELAGELAHLAAVRRKAFRPPRVTLVHTAERLVPHLAPNVSAAVESRLLAQGVEIRSRTRVIAGEPGGVRVRGPMGEEARLPAEVAFFCGGVRAPAVLASLGLPLTADGFVRVDPTLACAGLGPDVFAGGDCARVVETDDGGASWPTMQRAIECFWAAETIATQLVRLSREPVDYPRGVPSLVTHRLRPDFFHGLSLGGASLVVYGERIVDLGVVNIAFRRFLMWGYFRRYGQWSSRLTRALAAALTAMVTLLGSFAVTVSVAHATPPPTPAEAAQMRAAEAVTECLHCAGRGEPASKDYRTCPYLSPYGFRAEKPYVDGRRYGTFFCRPRAESNEALPADLRAKAENGEDDSAAKSAEVRSPQAIGGCALSPALTVWPRGASADDVWSGALGVCALAGLARTRRRRHTP